MANRGKGYTIVEVLIFLAASSFLIIAAMVALNGRQKEIQFGQSVREFEATIADLMNDVTTGYYETSPIFDDCREDSGQIKFTGSGSRTNNQNAECIYIGKVLQFFPKETDTSDPDFSKFNVYNLVGLRKNSANENSKNFNDALGQIEGEGDLATTFTESYNVRFGVEMYKIARAPVATSACISDPPKNSYDGVVMLSNFAGGGVSTNSSQTVALGAIQGHNCLTSSTVAKYVEKYGYNSGIPINTKLLDSNNPSYQGSIIRGSGLPSGLVFCLRDDEGRKASLTVGANGNNSTDLQIDQYNKGACG